MSNPGPSGVATTLSDLLPLLPADVARLRAGARRLRAGARISCDRVTLTAELLAKEVERLRKALNATREERNQLARVLDCQRTGSKL